MNDEDDNYDLMPIKRVDLILRQLRPSHWTPERLGGASPADKREAGESLLALAGVGFVRVRLPAQYNARRQAR